METIEKEFRYKPEDYGNIGFRIGDAIPCLI